MLKTIIVKEQPNWALKIVFWVKKRMLNIFASIPRHNEYQMAAWTQVIQCLISFTQEKTQCFQRAADYPRKISTGESHRQISESSIEIPNRDLLGQIHAIIHRILSCLLLGETGNLPSKFRAQRNPSWSWIEVLEVFVSCLTFLASFYMMHTKFYMYEILTAAENFYNFFPYKIQNLKAADIVHSSQNFPCTL